jgi:hypothetical protein
MSGVAAQTQGTARELKLNCPVAADIERRSRDVSVVRWSIGLAILAYYAVPAMAQSSIQTAFNYDFQEEAASPPAPGAAAHEPVAEPAPAAQASAPCDCASDSTSSCGCEASCGCENGCCSSCGGGNGCCCNGGWGLGDLFCCDCCLGEAWTLKDCLTPCCDHNYGGWISYGYYTDNDRFSQDPNDLFSFWDNPDQLNMDQAWLFFEKTVEGGSCCCEWGYRVDVVYGVDAQKTQAFGNSGGTWDVTFDHGSYGWAVPQAYLEFAYCDWNVKAGHFFTPLGYEVIPKTGNFFYSHSFTMFNSEPFTHTGLLTTYAANDRLTLYNGWTLGWDTGFDQLAGGSNYLGGFGYQVNDCVKYTYLCTAGDFGWRDEGYSHSNVLDVTLNDCWNYVLQSDLLDTDAGENTVGVVNYLFYTMNDCWKLGGRMEWWKANTFTDDTISYYAITGGVNYKPHANLVLRPEVKYNWSPANEAYEADNGEDFNQTLFGIDAILTF